MSAMTISEKSAVSENIDCYENLANAIVLQAVKDYKAALHTLEDYPESSFAKHEIVVQEKFFHSQWFGILTDLDPERLISGVKERVKIEAVERRRKKAERLRRKGYETAFVAAHGCRGRACAGENPGVEILVRIEGSGQDGG